MRRGGGHQQTGLINYRVTFMDSNRLVDIMANEYAYDYQTVLGAGLEGSVEPRRVMLSILRCYIGCCHVMCVGSDPSRREESPSPQPNTHTHPWRGMLSAFKRGRAKLSRPGGKASKLILAEGPPASRGFQEKDKKKNKVQGGNQIWRKEKC